MIPRIIVRASVFVCLLIPLSAPMAGLLLDRTQPSGSLEAAGPVRPEWKIGQPVSFENLTVFPVLSDDYPQGSDFITLDQGMQSGKVVITELSGQRSPDASAGRRAEVNRLSLSNQSDKILVLIAGEILMGGQQDRMVARDKLIAPGERDVELDVYCVEAGRWTGGASFGVGETIAAEGLQAGLPGSVNVVTRSGVESGGGSGQGVNLGGGSAPMANPSVRENGEAKKSQEGVWSKVASVNETVTVTASSSTLVANYSSKKLDDLMAKFRDTLEKLPGKNVVGAVVAVNGRIEIADVFENPEMFQSYWPKLLKSYGVEALSSGEKNHRRVSARAALAFLSAAGTGGTTEGKEGLYKLTEAGSKDDTSFVLEFTRKDPAVLIHFNRVTGL